MSQIGNNEASDTSISGKINPQMLQNLEIIKESFLDIGNEMQEMHNSFNSQIDLLTKMYEKQQMDYNKFKSEIENNISIFSKRIDSKLFNGSNI